MLSCLCLDQAPEIIVERGMSSAELKQKDYGSSEQNKRMERQ